MFNSNEWIYEVLGELSRKERFVNETGVFPIVSALNETSLWLNDKRSYSSMHSKAWDSVVADLEVSVDRLGRLVKSKIRRKCEGIIFSIKRLPLTNAALMNSASTKKFRKVIGKKVEKVREVLETDDLILKAWKDLIDAGENLSETPEKIRILRDILVDIAYLQKKNMGSHGLTSNLSGIFTLNLIPHHISSSLEPSYFPDDTELTEKYRIAEQTLIYKELMKARIVWVQIDRSHLQGDVLDCGDIKFFDSERLLDKDYSIKNENLPQEVRHNIEYFGNHIFQADKHRVLARVELQKGYISNAYVEARDLIESFVDINMKGSFKDWVVGDSHIVYVDNEEAVYTMSRSKELSDKYNPYNDSFAEMIENDKTSIQSVSSSHVDPQIKELRELMRDLKTIKDDANESILLGSTRMIEHINSWHGVTPKWYDFLTNTSKQIWAIQETIELIDSHVKPLLFTGLQVNGKEQTIISKLRRKIMIYEGNTYFSYSREKVLSNIKVISKHTWHLGRSRSYAWVFDTFSSGQNLASHVSQKELEFQNQLNRLVRYRNALEHGGPVSSEIAQSVSYFSYNLAFQVANSTLQAYLNGDNLQSYFSKQTIASQNKINRLRAGAKPITILSKNRR